MSVYKSSPIWFDSENPLSPQDLQDLKKYLIKTKKYIENDEIVVLDKVFGSIFNSILNGEGTNNYRSFACDVLSMWLVRSCQVISSNPALYTPQLSIFLTIEKANYMFQYILDFWNETGVALGNSLKDLFTRLLQFLNKSLPSEVREELYKAWLRKSLTIPYSMRVLYFMVDNLSREIDPASFVLNENPNFINESLQYIWSNSLAVSIGKTVSNLLKGIYNNELKHKEQEWLQIWQPTVFQALQNDKLRRHIELYILPNLFKLSSNLTIDFIRSACNEISLLLGCVKIAQDLAIIDPMDESVRQPITPYLKNLLSKQENANYRLTIFSIIIASPKGAQPISETIYKDVLDSIDIFMAETDLEIRNEALALIRTFISRVRDSNYALDRDIKKLKATGSDKFTNEIDEKISMVENGGDFINKLFEKLIHNLKPGSSYQRTSFSYHILISLITSGLDKRVNNIHYDKHKKSIDYPWEIKIYNETLIRLLIDNISDDFEDIRYHSIFILSMSPITIDNFVDLDLVSQRCMLLLNNMKGRSVDSGGRFFQFLFNYYQTNDNIDKCNEILNQLINKLCRGIRFAQTDLSTACYKENIHGYYAALKFVFEVIKVEKFPQINETIIKKIIECSSNTWKTVKIFLQDDSPEGNMPDEMEDTYNVELEAKYGKGTQVISSYSWRSLRESTRLLKRLLDNFELEDETVFNIGIEVLEQLETVKHKGGFSSVYPTFIACCKRCNKSDTGLLEDYPNNWLLNNVELVQSKSQLITRRSAGLPFMITAVLTSNPGLIESTFKSLISIAKLPLDSSVSITDLPQVNAFNCIKTIFVDSTLSDHSIDYIDQALELSLNSFGSKIWAIRNCSVMLFTAIQNRLFGTKKVANNGSLSTISARLFFTRYKTIKKVLFDSLIESNKNDLNDENVEKIFPILIILSRLEAVTGNEDELEDFKPFVLKFLENKYWKVREMASRSLPALISIDSLLIEYESCFNNLQVNQLNYNRMHGSILAIKELYVRSTLNSINSDNRRLNIELFKMIQDKLQTVLRINCYAIKLAYFKLLRFFQTELTSNDVNLLRTWFIEENGKNDKLDGSKQLALQECNLILLNYYNNTQNMSDLKDVIELSFYSPFYNVQISTIEFCELNFSSLSVNINSMIINKIWEILKLNSWKFIKSKHIRLLKLLITSTNEEQDNNDLNEKIEILLSIIQNSSNEDMRLKSLESIGSLIGKYEKINNAKNHNDDYFNNWLKQIKYFGKDEMEFTTRLSSLRSLISFNEIYHSMNTKHLRDLIEFNHTINNDDVTGERTTAKGYKVLSILFNYLSDDDEDIRQIASGHLSKFFGYAFNLVPTETERKLLFYFIKTLTATELNELLIFDNDFEYLSFIFPKSFKQLFTNDELLFTIEKHNFYRSSISRNDQLSSALQKTDHRQSITKFVEYLNMQTNELVETIEGLNIGKDGCFGWLMDEDKFSFVYCLVDDLITVVTLGYKESIDFACVERTLGGEDIHPLIKQKVKQLVTMSDGNNCTNNSN